jgi:tripartite-type tricarboxylate transporter receptor subunit TctC
MVLCGASAAQNYPVKAIRIVVPFPAGGIADIFARTIGGKLNDAWAQQVVVDNRPGAGGNIGAEIVAKSPPDGYTLVMGSIGTHAVNVSLFSKLPYDPVRDFAPVALVMEADGLLVLHPSVPVRSVKELITLAKNASRADRVRLGGERHGQPSRRGAVQVDGEGRPGAHPVQGQRPRHHGSRRRPDFAPFRYDADGDAHGAGRAPQGACRYRRRALAGGARAADDRGDGPAGFEVTNWIGLFAPAGTPREIVGRLNAEANRTMQQPEIRTRLTDEGAKFTARTPESSARSVKPRSRCGRR